MSKNSKNRVRLADTNVKKPIMKELEDKFNLLFEKLKVVNSKALVDRTVKPVIVEKKVSDTVMG